MWLLLKRNIKEIFKNDENYTYIFPINKFNFFVGKNNSGKSYFMRFILNNYVKLYKDIEDVKMSIINQVQNLKIIPQGKNFKNKKILEIYNENLQLMHMLQKIIDSATENNGITYSYSFGIKGHNYKGIDSWSKEIKPLIKFLNYRENEVSTYFLDVYIYPKQSEIKEKIVENFKTKIIEYINTLDSNNVHEIGELYFLFGDVKDIEDQNTTYYIPTTRGLRNPLKDTSSNEIQEDIYKNRTLSEYKFNTSKIEVVTGLDLYTTYKKNLLGSKEKRKKINDFEKFLSEYFFDNAGISIIPDEETFELKVNINNEQNDKFIYEVGDGISSLIILMYVIFMEADEIKNKLFFIEEPENSFHPGFQRLLINILSTYKEFKNCIIFFSTHSNHLIDIGTSEVKNSNVYLCKKQKNNELEIKYQDDEFNEIISELGVQASSVRIANKVIWVEGKYDAFYMRLLLKLREIADENKVEDDEHNNDIKKYIEDYDYCYLPYGGANIKLIDFGQNDEISEENTQEFITKAEKINPDFLITLDDDGMEETNGEKLARYKKLERALGAKIYKLEVREIENLFPEEVVKKFIEQGLKQEFKEQVDLTGVEYEDYKGKKLGKYINELIQNQYDDIDLKDITNRKEGFEKNGFLYDKQKFYDCVLEWSKKKDFNYENDVPLEAKKLVDTIKNFISK